MLLFDFIESTDTAADQNAVAVRITFRQIDLCLINGLLRGDHGKLAEAIDTPQFFALNRQMRQWIEVSDFASETHLEVATVKPLDGTDTTFSCTDRCPDVVQFAAKRSDNAKPGHYYSTA
jgi:hypothetical protein